MATEPATDLIVATTSEFAPRPTAIWRRYLELTKPKVVALITFTAIVGTLLSSPGMPPLDALIWGNLGIALASGCAATINHVLDRRIDEQMNRTRARPPERGGRVAALALTAFARLEDAIRARSSGYQGHLAKPISPEDLATAIAKLQREGGFDTSV